VLNRLNLISYANGKNSIFEIALMLRIKLRTLVNEYKLLKKNKIIF